MAGSTISNERLVLARVQSHHAAQVLAATCDTLLDRADDDSQSSLAWDAERTWFRTRRLPAGSFVAFSIAQRALVAGTQDGVETTIELHGRTRTGLLEWAAAHVPELAARDERPVVRSYDLPASDVADGRAFDASDADAFAALSALFADANHTLAGVRASHGPATSLLLWPHHFDLGSVLLFAEDDDPAQDPCVGIGFAAGDDAIEEPYYYVNPYAIDRPDDLPALGSGEWADAWFGGVLRARDARPGDLAALVEAIVEFTRARRSTA